MNIWVEYFRYEDSRKNTWAQIRENPKWNPPDSDKISKRFCQNREDANKFAIIHFRAALTLVNYFFIIP